VPGIAPFGYHIGVYPGTTTVVMLMLFVTSMLFICLGIIGEYLSVLVKEIKRRPTSIVNTTVGNPVAQVHAVPVLFTDRPPMQIEPSPSLPSLVGRHEW
jgi:hypothetical protein